MVPAGPALTIIADDLTGACDTGALFAGPGPVPVTVWPGPAAEAPVRVLDSETRTLDAGTAAGRVGAMAAAAPAARYFKKIDSTLRGHVAREAEAVLAAVGAPGALLTPAFPAQGRTVVDRVLRVVGPPDGSAAPAAGEPARPATAHVVDLLRAGLARPLAWIPLAEVRKGVEALAARLDRLADTVAVADAETDEDLALLVDAALARPRPPLLVGSAGLARPLARRLGLLAGPPALPRGRWLVVAGSRQPATRRQVESARRAGLRVLAAAEADAPEPSAVAMELAAEARRLIEREPFDLVVVTGGQTALALWRALGAERLDLVGAPAPGLALGYLRAPGRPALAVLTKAGGFGGPDLLVALARGAAA